MRTWGSIVGLGLIIGALGLAGTPAQARSVIGPMGNGSRAGATGVPVQDVPTVPIAGSSSDISPLPAGNAETFRGHPIHNGIIIGVGGGGLVLKRRYSRLVGTLYVSDNQGELEPARTFTIGRVASSSDDLGSATTIFAHTFSEDDMGDNGHPVSITIDIPVNGAGAISLSAGGVSRFYIVGNLIPTSPSFAPPTALAPTPNAMIPSGPLPFRWSTVPGAVAYYLQVWLVQPASSSTIRSSSATTTSVRVVGTGYSLLTAAYARGTYRWRLASIGASGISPWGPEQTVTLR